MGILEIQATSYDQFRIFARIIREVKATENCSYYVSKGNIYVTKGRADGFPCMVAHMDTLHNIAEDLTAVRIGRNIIGVNQVTMMQSGIGGDDKVGIFIALECLRLFENIKVAFFRDEETGCEGSYEADVSFFEDCNSVLQCDRRGHQDFIVEAGGVELSSTRFQLELSPLLDQFDYRLTTGLPTDVMALKELGIGCSMANLSCGYFNPHTVHEFVNIDCVEHCLNLVIAIIHQIGTIKFPHLPELPKSLSVVSQHSITDGALFCLDCWAPDPTHTGYCKACNEYYELMMK